MEIKNKKAFYFKLIFVIIIISGLILFSVWQYLIYKQFVLFKENIENNQYILINYYTINKQKDISSKILLLDNDLIKELIDLIKNSKTSNNVEKGVYDFELDIIFCLSDKKIQIHFSENHQKNSKEKITYIFFKDNGNGLLLSSIDNNEIVKRIINYAEEKKKK